MNVFQEQQVAESYDAYYHTELGRQIDAIEKQMLASLMQGLPRERLLDVGCGTGHWSRFFIEQGFQVTGLDASEAMLGCARSKGLDADFLQANAEALPLPDASFDVIATVTMLEFVEAPQAAIHEMHRVLRPGGSLFIGALNAASTLGKHQAADPVFRHARFFQLDEFGAYFQPFKIEKLEAGVYLDDSFQLLPAEEAAPHIEPAFFALHLIKSNHEHLAGN